MKRILNFLIGTELAALMFKPIEGGWAFKTPPFRRWSGLAMFYRVDDQKKAAIENLCMRMWRGGMLSIIPLVIIALAVKEIVPTTAVYELAYCAIAGTLLGLGMNFWFTASLRRELHNSAVIVENFNWVDQQKSFLRALSAWRALAYLAISLVLGCAVFLSARSGDIATPLAVTGLVLFGTSALYYIVVLVWKVRTQTTRQVS